MFRFSEYIQSYLGAETPGKNPSMEWRLATASHNVDIEVNDNKSIEKDALIVEVKTHIEIAKRNIEKEIKNPSQTDKKIINLLKETLTETFTNSYYMIQKVIKQNSISNEDRTDIENQKGNLEELNKYCENIYGKY